MYAVDCEDGTTVNVKAGMWIVPEATRPYTVISKRDDRMSEGGIRILRIISNAERHRGKELVHLLWADIPFGVLSDVFKGGKKIGQDFQVSREVRDGDMLGTGPEIPMPHFMPGPLDWEWVDLLTLAAFMRMQQSRAFEFYFDAAASEPRDGNVQRLTVVCGTLHDGMLMSIDKEGKTKDGRTVPLHDMWVPKQWTIGVLYMNHFGYVPPVGSDEYAEA